MPLEQAVRLVQMYAGQDGIVLTSKEKEGAAIRGASAEQAAIIGTSSIAAQSSAAAAEIEEGPAASAAPMPPNEASIKSLAEFDASLLECSINHDIDGVEWKKKGVPFDRLCRKHDLHFGAITGLEPAHAPQAANRMALAPALYWWDPRAAFPDSKLFVDSLDDRSRLHRYYEKVVQDLPRCYREYPAV